ncbi:MAG: pyruvate dehydrogenase (acetyl-transferring), homodimeric type, partial [Actinomycetia bacterium]|nr:pyruvate dehydrogenase (acetyl-transferring), homodimeric type [Actinomycetes bacterium]
PVRGNGKIIQELEAVFRGAGWNVIKVVWGSRWDELLQRDVDGVLLNKMNTTVDGEFQRYAVESGAYIREKFFGPDPRLRRLVDHLNDDDLANLPRGGHDYQKVYAAYKAATEHVGQPTVILAKTIKGWTLGEGLEGRNATHQIKKMTKEQMLVLRDRLQLGDDIATSDLEDGIPPYFRPSQDSAAFEYMSSRRRALDGPLPQRMINTRRPLPLPSDVPFKGFEQGSGGRAVSTTMAFTSMLRELMREEGFGQRVVPIVPDEARTFGMDSMFREFEIYAPFGQKYEPVDHELLLSYSEDSDGQILEEGITEAGSLASWIAAATSYAHRGVPMVPFCTFYSMFGFQRVGDLIWSAADSRARGFLMAATAGRTTLAGEGLQHQDGHSLLNASVVPACEAYDPAFAYELAVIIKDGIERMYLDDEDVFYYLTIYNENYAQPAQPVGSTQGIINGLYQWAPADESLPNRATILFSGPSQGPAREAQAELAERWDVGAELWSATSYKRLREEALEAQRWNRLHPTEEPRRPLVTRLLSKAAGPVIAVTDYVRAVPEQISSFVPGPFVALGTDGYGRSDTREALRSFFETDAPNIVVTVLHQLAQTGDMTPETVARAISHYGLVDDIAPSWRR